MKNNFKSMSKIEAELNQKILNVYKYGIEFGDFIISNVVRDIYFSMLNNSYEFLLMYYYIIGNSFQLKYGCKITGWLELFYLENIFFNHKKNNSKYYRLRDAEFKSKSTFYWTWIFDLEKIYI